MSISISDFNTLVKTNIQGQINNEFIAPLVIVGNPGLGKTSFVKSIANELNMSLLNQSIAALDSVQLSGIPDFYIDTSFSKYNVLKFENVKGTIWSIPELVMQANKLAESNENGCILLLDDIHETNMAVQPYLYELLLERKLGQYKFHDKVAIVATANTSDEAHFKGFSSAVINRLAILQFPFDFEYWFNTYAIHFHTYLSSFIRAYKNYVQESESVVFENYGTPRSLDFLNTHLMKLDDEFIIRNSFVLAKQYMSTDAATAFKSHCIQLSKIDFKVILRNNNIIDVHDKEMLEQMLYAYIVRYVETEEDAITLLKILEKNKDVKVFVSLVGSLLISILSSEPNLDNLNPGYNILLSVIFNVNTDSSKSVEIDQDLLESLRVAVKNMAEFL